MSEAQRYPKDYDGVVAGAPANNRTHLHAEFLWNFEVTNLPQGAALLPPGMTEMVMSTAINQCHGKDGGSPADNFLTDARLCHFDPSSIPACTIGKAEGCLTAPQLGAMQKIYAGPSNSRTGQRIYAPIPFGAESPPADKDTVEAALFYPSRWALNDNCDEAAFDFDRDMQAVDARVGRIVNANLSAFEQAGGKLLMFGGTADTLVSFPDALNYYERVVAAAKTRSRSTGEPMVADSLEPTQKFSRYFHAPGMGHCGGDPGITDFGQAMSATRTNDVDHDILTALLAWKESGRVPEQFAGRTYVDDRISMERPVCAYPKFPTMLLAIHISLPVSPAAFMNGGVWHSRRRYTLSKPW